MKLSRHFTLEEMVASQTASRRRIPNIPDEQAIAALRALCTVVLDEIRDHYAKPITPSSGFRCPKLNMAIGGSRTSQHCEGEAVDFVVPGVSVPEVCKWIRSSGLPYDQLIEEFASDGGGWVHVSHRRSGGNRKQFLKIG